MTVKSTFRVAGRACLVCAVVSIAACGPHRPNLLPVSLPDLSRADRPVQSQARDLYAQLTKKIGERGVSDDELAMAYGRMGMVLQAAEYYDAAEPYYLNAQSLVPAEVRWPYYLGHLYRDRGETDKAEAFWKRVLELQPDDVATLVWLGRVYLDKGRPQDADPLFTRALGLAPGSIAVLAGLGRVALARRDYATAAKHLEAALAIDPEADSLHAPLAMAYRGLGDLAKAEPHLRKWRNRDVLVPDPLRQELDLVLESGLSYELRGVRALEAKDWPAAAGFFRKGLELSSQNTPLTRSLHHKLGTALFMSGDPAGAATQFAEVVRLSPPDGIDESSAKAHYSLALLMAEKRRTEEAIQHFSAAVKYQPTYVEAYIGLGDALRRTGRMQPALEQYKEAVALNPRGVQGRLGYAVALVGLHRYRDARDWLLEATRLNPDRQEFALALARLLASAPDARVRDGERAMGIVQELLKTQKTTPVGEAFAMALAELGEYDKAAAIQRGVMDAARQARLNDVMPYMEANLRLYEHHQPCRTPWRDDEPVHLPSFASGP